jgi:lipopolysaccharide/colanic/teichoic acid biosynthesis glycosyltransferase
MIEGELEKQSLHIYESYIKRLLDFLLALLALLILSPILLLLCILVRVKIGAPVLFCQDRPGRNEKIFTIYKFRTMTEKKDTKGNLLGDGERLTAFGRFLRASSMDELPELFNIFKGEMSIVGPRPLLVQYLPLYNDEQRRRHEVRPGLTGLAQVYGRNAISWEEKFALDLQYVNHVSFAGDVRIFFRTVRMVFAREGINAQNAATMELFMGTKRESDK